MTRLCLLLAVIFITIEADASDYCDGFERGYKAVKDRGYVPVCGYMPYERNRPKSDYEFGYLKGVERAKKDSTSSQAVNPPVVNNRRNDCDCGKLSTIQSAQSIFGPSMRDIAEQRKDRKLNDLRREAEIEALNAQIRLSKSQGATPTASKPAKPKWTKELRTTDDLELLQVKVKAKKLQKYIHRLAAGGDQPTRQKNYDEAIAVFKEYAETSEKFFDKWTDPKYSK